ncbi:hypothetical protein [Stenotrophomonas sp. MMGLT7]|uniref:hypothetical protein n=1 Tax=Stenotrophomonas sp. MMGLT7 TaxID=2901227 RepID=UPI001E2F746E|nr:hypothetical protein [Stenotrophomonas sp. MMGLT7]MCD7098745.1 hypothetical protein [Stenotrophomonas sp. MMGLT7]
MKPLDPASMDTDPDGAALLEGLLQLAIAGHTEGPEFEQLDGEVYRRLYASYGVQTKLAGVQLRGSEPAKAA